MIKAIVTDIEGTTTKLSFVKDILFPYSYDHLRAYVSEHKDRPNVVIILNEVREEVGNPDLTDEGAVAQLLEWIKQDKKITPLKTLQGYIWNQGYQKGDLTGHVYSDAIEKLNEWHKKGITLAIFSSGSILAQKLLFSHTIDGDLTPLFSHFFDTTTGAKNNKEAYQHIAEKLNLPANEILFLSDIQAELDAAASADMKTCGLVREGTAPIKNHPIAANFNEVKI